MKICVNCGDKLLDAAKKCPSCGANAKNFPIFDKNDKASIEKAIASIKAKDGTYPEVELSFMEKFSHQIDTVNDQDYHERISAEERKAKAAEDGIACCPKCGSTSISAGKKGFGFGKAIAGAALAPVASVPVGILAGGIGANKVEITCLNCGHKWRPGKK